MLRQKPSLSALTSTTQAEPSKGLLLSKPAAMTEKKGDTGDSRLSVSKRKNMWCKDCKDCLTQTGQWACSKGSEQE